MDDIRYPIGDHVNAFDAPFVIPRFEMGSHWGLYAENRNKTNG
jgi:hypothetical protein